MDTKFVFLLCSLLSMSAVVKSSVNLATGNIVTNHSSDFNTKWVSSKAVDGCTRQIITSDCCSHTSVRQTEAWWQVDLRRQSVIERVNIIYRECIVGFFGNHCDQPCPGNCENNTCNKDSGLCTECISGFYGNVCDQACPDNCGNNICSMQDGQCLIPLPESQTDTGSYIGFYTGYAVLGAFLGISVCFNICLIVLFLRQAKKTKSANEPAETFGMQTIRNSSESRNYEGLDVTKVDNVKNIYDSIQE